LALGHSGSFCNIAISASKDGTCNVWDYQSNNLLRAVLLPAIPLCIALDPADRAFYVGYEDGSVQMVDFYSESFDSGNIRSINDKSQSAAPIQPQPRTRWYPPQGNPVEATLSIIVSYDGTKLITGHESGKIATWDIPRSRFATLLTSPSHPGPVTNLVPLPVTGFPEMETPSVTQHTVLKPRQGEFDTRMSGDGRIPANYSIAGQFSSTLPFSTFSATEQHEVLSSTDFERALAHPSFPPDMMTEALAELDSWTQTAANGSRNSSSGADFMALDQDDEEAQRSEQLEAEVQRLKDEVEAIRRVQKASFVQMDLMRKENKDLEDQVKLNRKQDLEVEMQELDQAEQGWSDLATPRTRRPRPSNGLRD